MNILNGDDKQVKIHKHWLKIDWRSHGESSEDKQWNNLNDYIVKYPESKITVYNKTSGIVFEKVFCLETNQNYDELDLDCNSFFKGSLSRMERKPSNVEQSKLDFVKHYDIHFECKAVGSK